jgi:hypothetical protein
VRVFRVGTAIRYRMELKHTHPYGES